MVRRVNRPASICIGDGLQDWEAHRMPFFWTCQPPCSWWIPHLLGSCRETREGSICIGSLQCDQNHKFIKVPLQYMCGAVHSISSESRWHNSSESVYRICSKKQHQLHLLKDVNKYRSHRCNEKAKSTYVHTRINHVPGFDTLIGQIDSLILVGTAFLLKS